MHGLLKRLFFIYQSAFALLMDVNWPHMYRSSCELYILNDEVQFWSLYWFSFLSLYQYHILLITVILNNTPPILSFYESSSGYCIRVLQRNRLNRVCVSVCLWVSVCVFWRVPRSVCWVNKPSTPRLAGLLSRKNQCFRLSSKAGIKVVAHY